MIKSSVTSDPLQVSGPPVLFSRPHRNRSLIGTCQRDPHHSFRVRISYLSPRVNQEAGAFPLPTTPFCPHGSQISTRMVDVQKVTLWILCSCVAPTFLQLRLPLVDKWISFVMATLYGNPLALLISWIASDCLETYDL